jgi:hypothetical protein
MPDRSGFVRVADDRRRRGFNQAAAKFGAVTVRKPFLALIALCLSAAVLLSGCGATDTITRKTFGAYTMSAEKFVNGRLSVSFGSFSGSDSLFITPEKTGTYTVKYSMAITDGLMTVNVLQGKELIESVPIYAGEAAADELSVNMEGGKSYEVKILATECTDGRYEAEIIKPE